MNLAKIIVKIHLKMFIEILQNKKTNENWKKRKKTQIKRNKSEKNMNRILDQMGTAPKQTLFRQSYIRQNSEKKN